MSYLDNPVSQIATQIPGATAVLFRHKINFCCDGNITLQQALDKKHIEYDQVIDELEAISQRDQEQQDWENCTNEHLISHILQRFHEVHRQQLPELIRLASRVETVHGAHPLCPKGLAQHLEQMHAELSQHMQKEEGILFPMLTQGSNPMVAGPISVMMTEHEDHFQDIERIYQLTNDVSLHPDACNTWRALYLGLQEFISDINMHIHLENDVLFARASA